MHLRNTKGNSGGFFSSQCQSWYSTGAHQLAELSPELSSPANFQFFLFFFFSFSPESLSMLSNFRFMRVCLFLSPSPELLLSSSPPFAFVLFLVLRRLLVLFLLCLSLAAQLSSMLSSLLEDFSFFRFTSSSFFFFFFFFFCEAFFECLDEFASLADFDFFLLWFFVDVLFSLKKIEKEKQLCDHLQSLYRNIGKRGVQHTTKDFDSRVNDSNL